MFAANKYLLKKHFAIEYPSHIFLFMRMNIREIPHNTNLNEYSTFLIVCHERSAEFQPLNRFAIETECMFKFEYE